jgi:hypothetical protein
VQDKGVARSIRYPVFSATGLVGARLHFTDAFGVFVEGRYTTALVKYSRDIKNETDEAAFKGYGILSGIALKF